MSELSYRPGGEGDFPALTEVWHRSVLASHDFLTPDQIEGYRRRLPDEFLPAVEEIVIAERDGEPVGFIGMNGEEIEMLFVVPESHGTGVGRGLIDLVAEKRNRLTLEVNEQNPKAHAFYLHLGFRDAGRTKLDPDGNPFPMIRMERAGTGN